MSERRQNGQLERAVLEQLWLLPDGATPREVMDRLDKNLAYTTVMTILTRLWRKGLVTREAEGRAYRYTVLATEADLTAERMRSLLDPANDRHLVLSRFVSGLSKRDEAALRKVLDDLS